MTSITTSDCRTNQNSKNHYNDESTSDDSLLLMGDDMEEKAPLLNILTDDLDRDALILSTDIPLRPRSTNSHCHVPDDKFDYTARNRLIAVLIVCVVFMVIEIIGGILSNSTAIATDAAHMCIDAASFLISLAAMYLARRKPTKKLSYGYIRAEILGALVSVLTIWVATGILVYMAIGRCVDQSFEVKPLEMIIVASCGVVFNIVMFFVLHANVCGNSLPHHGHSHGGGHGHSHNNHSHTDNDDVLSVEITSPDHQHSHSHSHSHHKPSKSSNNINVRAAVIHVIGDFVQSVGVLCAAILIKLKPEYKLADPICTFIFSILVLITTITIMRDIVVVLMEGVPSHVNYSGIVDDLLRLPDVRNAHSLHIWSLSTQKVALSVHIAIENEGDSMRVLTEAQEMLRRDHGISRSTIQVEMYDANIMNSCDNCQRPDV
ncbi:unnamed protein product [Adineta ricciae]|uniref:Uncharacterized protein n=1 Tax=Adineta ricciae TaxID=249248 RepID=A0A813MEC5_ADIRI|nr:unnamed protein product [Adineta ricciae]CAF0987430.1 unnamed protein product [Adineta ricciae]